MSAATASEFRTGIGARLKSGRERLGLTLLQAAEKLHVDPSVVEKLEAERFGEFVAPVYVKGHIKRYSELVSENTQELLDLHAAATKPVLPDLTQLPKASQHAPDLRKLVLPSLVVLIGFALIGTVWWVLQNVGKLSGPVGPQAVQVEEPPVDDGSAEIVPRTTTSPEAAAPGARNGSTNRTADSTRGPGPASGADQSARTGQVPVPAQPTTPSTGTPRSTERSASGADQSVRTGQVPVPAQPTTPNVGAAQPQSPPVAAAGRGTGTRAGTSVGAASGAQITKSTRVAAAATPPPQQPADAPRLKSVDVTLRFASDSWAEVYDANGRRLFYDIGSANSSHAVTGTPPLRVVLGNAPGVRVNINGRPAKVPASAVQNDSAQFTINRSGRIVRARPDDAASATSKPNGE